MREVYKQTLQYQEIRKDRMMEIVEPIKTNVLLSYISPYLWIMLSLPIALAERNENLFLQQLHGVMI